MNEEITFRVHGEEYKGRVRDIGKQYEAYGYVHGRHFAGEKASTPLRAVENLESRVEMADLTD